MPLVRPAGPRWFGGGMPVARFGLILNLLVPLALLVWDARHHALGPDAVNFAIHTTGIVAVVCLVLSLAVTPVRQVTGWNWFVQFRRSLGVYAFYYAAAHLSIYFWWEQGHDLRSTAYEITHRYYLAIGFSSLALMAPLWATSFNAAIKAMGGVWWKRLHKLAYVAAGLAVYHYYLQSKADKRIPWDFAYVLAGLMVWRAVALTVHYVRTPAKPRAITTAGGKARSWKGELKVVGMFRETASVRTFRLAPADGGPIPFAFRAGQFLNLMVDVDGTRVGRSYTIASPPTRDGYVELTIKREENGLVSRHLHDRLMTGGSVVVSAPAGRFTFDPAQGRTGDAEGTDGQGTADHPAKPARDDAGHHDAGGAANAAHAQAANAASAAGQGNVPMGDNVPATRALDGVLLIAGGVGVTPVMSILRDLTDRCWPGQIDLVFSVRTPADVIFADELHYLAGRFPNVHVHVTVTRDAPADWTGPTGHVTADMLRRLVPDVAARPAFICGPDALAKGAKDELLAAGVPEGRITVESFTPAPAKAAPGGTDEAAADEPDSTTGTVTFQRSGQSAPLSPRKTILDLAESAGVQIDYQCRSGICGTCKCKLLEGHVSHATRDALSDEDDADGYILACQAHATEDVTVDA